MDNHFSQNKFDLLRKNAVLELKNLGDRVKANLNAEFKYEMGVIDLLITQSMQDGESIQQIVEDAVLPDVADVILNNMAQKKQIHTVTISSNRKNQQLNYTVT
ncbi:MAG: hypothetical protein IT497_09475 [Ottowia sp.]|nr:hypothetical protein [Ottowia sp.]